MSCPFLFASFHYLKNIVHSLFLPTHLLVFLSSYVVQSIGRSILCWVAQPSAVNLHVLEPYTMDGVMHLFITFFFRHTGRFDFIIELRLLKEAHLNIIFLFISLIGSSSSTLILCPKYMYSMYLLNCVIIYFHLFWLYFLS